MNGVDAEFKIADKLIKNPMTSGGIIRVSTIGNAIIEMAKKIQQKKN